MRRVSEAAVPMTREHDKLPSPNLAEDHGPIALRIITAAIIVILAGALVWAYQPTYCKEYKVEDFCPMRSDEYPGCLQKAEQTVLAQRSWCWKWAR